MFLEWANSGVMARCPYNFGHFVSLRKMTDVCTRQEEGRDQRPLMMVFCSGPWHDFVSKASPCAHVLTGTYPGDSEG